MEKIIKRAEHEGYWEDMKGESKRYDRPLDLPKNVVPTLIEKYKLNELNLLCNHDFAKCFFGEEMVCPGCGMGEPKEGTKLFKGRLIPKKDCTECGFEFIKYRMSAPPQGIQRPNLIMPGRPAMPPNMQNREGNISIEAIRHPGLPSWIFHLRNAIVFKEGMLAYYNKFLEAINEIQ